MLTPNAIIRHHKTWQAPIRQRPRLGSQIDAASSRLSFLALDGRSKPLTVKFGLKNARYAEFFEA